MPPRRRRAPGVGDIAEDIARGLVESGAVDDVIGSVFGRAAEFVDRVRMHQHQSLPSDAQPRLYTCVSCRQNSLGFDVMEMINPRVVQNDGSGWGTCKRCFAFIWQAGAEKVRKLAAERAAAGRPPGATGATPGPRPAQRKPPAYEILGVKPDTPWEEVKKAYKKLVLDNHPDRLEGAPFEQKEASKVRMQEITAAYEAMRKLNEPAK